MLGMPVTKGLKRFGPDPGADVQVPFTIASREWVLGHGLHLLMLHYVDDQTCKTTISTKNQYVVSGRSLQGKNRHLRVLNCCCTRWRERIEDNSLHSTLMQDRNANSKLLRRGSIVVQNLGSRRRRLL